MKFILTVILTAAALDLQAQEAVPKPFVFGHDKDVPLAASVIGASDFLFMDWDGDGDNDMMTTSGGSVKLIENIGSKKKPRFNNVFIHNQVVLKDARVGRFFSLVRQSGVKAQQGLPSFIAFERHNQISNTGKKQLALHMFIPLRQHGKTTWKVMQAFNRDGKPVQDFLDCWVSPTIDVADLDGDGKEDLIVGSSHPQIAQPSLNFAAGYNNPQESWNPYASRFYIMYNRSSPDSLIFDRPLLIEAGGSPVSAFGFPYPIAFDVNNDGLTDLVAGQHKPGLLYFRNAGTKTQPRFTAAGLLTDGHKEPISSILAIHPRFADLDGDGRQELLASTYFGCVDNILRFKPKNGGWAEQGPLMMASDKNTPVMPQGIGTIEPVDWDGDGDTDLVAGSEPAAPKVIINQGTNAKPVWEVPAPLKFTDGTRLEYYSIDYGLGSVWGPMEWYMERVLPRLADWDGDGTRDMLTGSMGLRQLFLKGRVIKGELRFEKPVVFKVEGKPLAAGQRVQPAILDLNADTYPDLIALDDQNILKCWPGKGTDELGQPQAFLGHDEKPLQIKTRILDIGHGRCSFTMTDWDLDGNPDLLVYYAFDRKRGGIFYYRASGKPMQFEKPVKLSNLLSFHNGGISLADWDGDGYLDIFTGGDGGHLGRSAVPRGKLFLLSGKELPVPPAVRKQRAGKTLRVLMIGNSFSQNASRYLPQMAEEANINLVLGRAEMGGCSLKRHWDSVLVNDIDTGKGKAYKGRSLRQLLSSQKWDIVTMQQYSLLSGDEATYQPYAKNIYDLVKSYQPDARVFVHQTWAYRADAVNWGKIDGEKRAENNKEMWERSRAAYHLMAKSLGNLPIIPSGDAFYQVATDKKWGFKKDTAFDYAHPIYPALPSEENSINAGYSWGTDKKLKFDPNHANEAGCYLAGLVWYCRLFEGDPTQLKFKPQPVSDEFAAFLKETALKTVRTNQK